MIAFSFPRSLRIDSRTCYVREVSEADVIVISNGCDVKIESSSSNHAMALHVWLRITFCCLLYLHSTQSGKLSLIINDQVLALSMYFITAHGRSRPSPVAPFKQLLLAVNYSQKQSTVWRSPLDRSFLNVTRFVASASQWRIHTSRFMSPSHVSDKSIDEDSNEE